MAVSETNPEQNKALVRRIPEEINTEKRLDLVDEVFAEDYVEHSPVFGNIRGRDAIREAFSAFQTDSPDVEVTVEHILCEDDMVAMHVRVRGTHEREFVGVPASGNEIDVTGLVLHRVEDGLVAERWAYFDSAEWMRQMGAAE